MATQAFTPAQLASNIAFQTAKKASPKVSTTPAPLQSLLKPQLQQSQATFSNNIPGVGLPQVNNPIKTAVKTPKTPAVLPATGSGKKSLSEFGETIKTKYPQYADMDSTELGKKMLEKYPQYADMVDTPNAAQNIAGGVVQSSIGLPQLGAKLINPVFNALDKYVIDPISKKLGADPNKVAQNTAQAQQARQGLMKGAETFGQQVTGGDPESTAFKGAKLVGDIAQTAILPGPGGLKAGAGFIKGVGQLAKQGAIETAKFTAISEKRLPTPKELAYGVGGNVALGGAIKGLQLTGKYLPKALKESANKSVSQALAPTGKKMKQITERLTPQFLKKGIRGSQESIQKLAQEGVEKFGSKIDDAIEGGALDDVFVPRQVVDDVLTLAKEKTMVDGKVVNTVEHRVISEMQDMISQFPDKVGGKQARAIKQILDKVVYATKGGIGAEDLSYKNTIAKSVADSLRNELSKASPDLAKLNKEFSFYKNLQDVIDTTITRQKPQQGAFRKFAGAIVGGSKDGGPIDKILSYIGTKLFLDATSSATRNTISAQLKNKLANGIAKLSGAEINSAIQAINKENPTLALPYYKEGLVFSTPRGQIGSARPTAKTPITIKEIQGLAKNPGTTKGGSPIPKKEVAQVKPKVESKYIPGKTDISNYTLSEYKRLIQQEFPGVHTESDIQRMYKTLQDEGTINKGVTPKTTTNTTPTPKANGVKPKVGLGKETLEQDIAQGDDLIQEAKKYSTTNNIKTIPSNDIIGMEDIDSLQRTIQKTLPEGKSITDWAKKVDLSEPVDVYISKQGDLTISDGHHRALAGRILGKEINVNIKSKLQGEELGKFISLIKKGYSTKQLYKSREPGTFSEQLNKIREQANKKPSLVKPKVPGK